LRQYLWDRCSGLDENQAVPVAGAGLPCIKFSTLISGWIPEFVGGFRALLGSARPAGETP
jgi:hypothetical protein